jgi:hypothetical protein
MQNITLWPPQIHFTGAEPGEVSMLAAAFDATRMDFTWTAVESHCGTYDWAAYDVLVASVCVRRIVRAAANAAVFAAAAAASDGIVQLSAAALTPYFILDYGNPCYDGGSAPVSEAGIAAFVRFAVAGVGRYGGRGVVWEVRAPCHARGLRCGRACVLAYTYYAWPLESKFGVRWVMRLWQCVLTDVERAERRVLAATP